MRSLFLFLTAPVSAHLIARAALQLAVRFSVLATIALVAVGVAGVILTVVVLDSPSELWATEWGRTLIAKTLFVAVAAAAGVEAGAGRVFEGHLGDAVLWRLRSADPGRLHRTGPVR